MTIVQLFVFFCGKGNSNKLEKINERALRIVFSDTCTPYVELLRKAKCLSLSMLRLKYLIVEVYKCIYNLNPKYLNHMFTIRNANYAFRDGSKALQQEFKSMKYGYRSFS